MSRNVHPNLVMLAQKDLILSPLYSNLNVVMDLQWNNLFSMHTTLSNQTNDQNISSFDDFDFENENHVICAPTNSMIHNFLDACFKINDYKNVIYSIASSQDFHPLGLFRESSRELNFLTLFYEHPQDLTISKTLSYQQITQGELLHKSKNFSINISNLFFKGVKISIQKIIGFRWVHKRKGKPNGGSLRLLKYKINQI
jgi:hypothetical protein